MQVIDAIAKAMRGPSILDALLADGTGNGPVTDAERRETLPENSKQGTDRFKAWAAEWRPIVPKAVACLEEDLESPLAFFSCPRGDWRTVRTTNAIERAFREVRRLTRPMSCFQNNASCEHIIYAVISHLNQRWSVHPLAQSTQLS